MSKGLKGEYNHSIDTKGRMIVPSKLREKLGLSFVVTKGLDGCLSAYPNDEWELFEEKLNQLPTKHREYKRFFLAGATDCEVDNQGRINLPNSLLEHAEIIKEVTVIGSGERAEIWSKEKWDAKNSASVMDFDAMAEALEEIGIVL